MATVSTGLATSFINFSRGSNATVTDRDGRIKWAGHNLLLASEQFNAAQWTAFTSTVTSNSATAPNGTTTADTFAADGTNNWHYLVGSASAGYPRTASFFVKKNTHDFVQILFSGDANPWANFDVATGVVGSSGTDQTASITSIGNGWYLCSVTTSSATAANVYISLVASASAGRASGGAFSTSVYLWGAHLYRSDMQMQQNPAMGAGMGSYYPTTPRNLLGFTEAFGSWGFLQEVQTSANISVAPNGLQTADKVSVNNGTTTVPTYAGQLVTQVVGTPYTYSIYVKKAETRYATIAFWYSQTNYAGMQFDFDTQTITRSAATGTNYAVTTADFVSVGNGWYRLRLLGTVGQTNGAIGVVGTNTAWASGAPIVIQTGNGSDGVLVWGAQLSDSASLDTYTPVYGAAVTSAAYYAPRLDFDGATLSPKGLLVEEQATNLLQRTAEFDNAYWTKTALNTTGTPAWVNVAVAPDGTTTAEKLIADNTTAIHHVAAGGSFAAAAYTTSVFAKEGEYRYVTVCRTNGGGIHYAATVDLRTGTVTQETVAGSTVYSTTTVNYGNGWWRIQSYGNATNGNYVLIGISNTATYTPSSNGMPSFTGDGTSGIFIWGAQIEARAFATSYIPNVDTAAGVTRTADVASVSTQAFPYSATEGTIVVNATSTLLPSAYTNGRAASLNDGTANNVIELYISQNAAVAVNAAGRVMVSGVQQTNPSKAITNNANPHKTAFAYKASDFAVTGDGLAPATETSGSLPTSITQMQLGALLSTNYLNGHIRQITYIPRRISNAELQSRTA